MRSSLLQILPRGAIEGHPLWSWLQDPGEIACLPSGGFLMVSKGHGVRVLDSAAADTPRVTQIMNLVPELASAFTTLCSRMGQKQVCYPPFRGSPDRVKEAWQKGA